MAQHTFTFMGTGAGCGVPAFFCDCPACQEARQDPRARRGCCGIMVRGEKTLLIDTPPDIRSYLIRENVRVVDELLYTHAHFDHLGGMGELEYMMRLITKAPLPTYGSETALSGMLQEFHYMDDVIDCRPLEPYGTHEFDGVRYTALPVAHAPGTYGYLIETENTRVFYASDTARLPEETAERIRGVDVLAMDATFWESNWSPAAHHSVQECIDEGLELDAGIIYLTHLAMHYNTPVTLSELEAFCAQYSGRVKPAADGLSFAI